MSTTSEQNSTPSAGAPAGNANAVRHGLTTGSLPAGCAYITKVTNEFRRGLEGIVLASKGTVTLYDAAAVNSAIRWERHSLLSQRWLRTEADLTASEKLNFSREVARASTERDRCLKLLGLDRDTTHDPWKILDAPRVTSESAPKPTQPATPHDNGNELDTGAPEASEATERAPTDSHELAP